MGCTGEIPTHQCTGDVSCSICYLPLQRVSCAQHCFIRHGQHHCNVLHTQARGDEVQSPLENNSDVIRSVKSTQHRTELSTYRRETEHDSGQALEARSNSSHRMELTPCDPGSGLADLEQTNDRLVCNPGQQKDAVVCVSNSRSGGLGSGCSQPELEPVICICLSSDSDSSASAKKGADVELRDYSDSPGLAKTAVVCQHSGALNREKMLKQPRSDIFHQNPQLFQFHAWRLSSSLIKQRDFQSQQLPEWLELKKTVH